MSRVLSVAMVVATGLLVGGLGGCTSAAKTTTPEVPARASLAEVREMNQRALNAQKSGKTEEAIELYRKVVQLEPRMHQAWNNLGVLYMEQNNYVEAAVALKSAADLEPSDPVPLENLGLAYYRAGFAHKSLEYYLEAMERDENRPEAYRGAFKASEQLGLRDEDALDRVERALMVEPDEAWRELYMRKKVWLSTEVSNLSR
jgi:tetratricopeptide (TPR) repeat protein